jgi:hypothetical protein
MQGGKEKKLRKMEERIVNRREGNIYISRPGGEATPYPLECAKRHRETAVVAPVIPYRLELLWQNLGGEESFEN